MLGSSLGLLSNFLPSHMKSEMIRIVDDSSHQQLNDGIRRLSSSSTPSSLNENTADNKSNNDDNNSSSSNGSSSGKSFIFEDARETLKFHRDLRHSIQDSNSTEGVGKMSGVSIGLSQVLYRVIKLSEKI